VALFGMAAEASIGVQFAALVVPFVLAAAGTGLLYAIAPARAVTPWLAGPLLALIAGLPLLTGFLTPTEWIAFLALAGIVVGLPVQTLALALPFGVLLRQLATEIAAIVVVFAAAALVSTAVAFAGGTSVIADLVGTGTGVLVLGAAAFFLLCYVLSAALALLLAPLPLMPVIAAAGIDPMLAGAILVLLALAAMAARSGRRSGAGLTPAAALSLAAMLAGLAILLALVPAIATAPAAFIR
jgi:TRAP-type C4-dicarboxylate transport system permease large subunit